jgi:hypothetical protein
LVVSVLEFAIKIVEARLKLTPSKDEVQRLHHLQPFDPEWHLFQLDLWTNFRKEELTRWIQIQCLFWLVFAININLKHIAPINSCRDQR